MLSDEILMLELEFKEVLQRLEAIEDVLNEVLVVFELLRMQFEERTD